MTVRSSPLALRRRRRAFSSLFAGVLVAGLTVLVPAVPAQSAPLSSCVSGDNGDPTLNSFTITPGNVNVTTGARTVSFAATASDSGGPGAATGVGSMSASMSSPGAPYRSLYVSLRKNAAGTWVGTATVPRWTTPGTWTVGSVYVSDKANNYRFYSTTQLQTNSYDYQLVVTATPDATPPLLTSFTFSPGSVDTRTASKNVVFTARATDQQSGVFGIYVSASEPSTTHQGSAFLRKVVGTANTYRGTMVIPRWQTNGTWHVDSVNVSDRIGNYRNYTYADLGSKGFKRNLSVVSRSDTAAPTLASFARTPAAVDVRFGNKSVTATLRARDGASGVVSVGVTFTVPGPSSRTQYFYMRRVSGSALDGVWKGSSTVLRCYAIKGTYQAKVTLYDAAGNTRVYSATALHGRGWPSRLGVTARDNTYPNATGPATLVPPTSPATVSFSENVNGINANTAVVREGYPFSPGVVVAGTWACKTVGGVTTSCATGQVRTASFTPTSSFTASTSHYIELNPEHQLGVTDLAGNPFDRYTMYFLTGS